MNVQAARVLFDEVMEKVKKQTGRDPKTSLIMSCGPEDAEIFYNQMFACFYSGLSHGINMKN
jgi:hypothetical protein